MNNEINAILFINLRNEYDAYVAITCNILDSNRNSIKDYFSNFNNVSIVFITDKNISFESFFLPDSLKNSHILPFKSEEGFSFQTIFELESKEWDLLNATKIYFLNCLDNLKLLLTKASNIFRDSSEIFQSQIDSKYVMLDECFFGIDYFLGNLYKEDFSNACYLILNNKQLESEYYIESYHDNKSQDLLHFEFQDKWNYGICKINNIRTEHDNDLKEKSAKILKEFQILFFGSVHSYSNGKLYKNEKPVFILCKINDINFVHNIKNRITEKYRFCWIDERRFKNRLAMILFKETKESLWQTVMICGITIRKYNFHHRYSDFGSDNYFFTFNGDSNYFDINLKPKLTVRLNPRHCELHHRHEEYFGLETNAFDYFFESKKKVLINFDEISVSKLPPMNWFVTDILYLVKLKVIRLPLFLLDNTYILTKDIL